MGKHFHGTTTLSPSQQKFRRKTTQNYRDVSNVKINIPRGKHAKRRDRCMGDHHARPHFSLSRLMWNMYALMRFGFTITKRLPVEALRAKEIFKTGKLQLQRMHANAFSFTPWRPPQLRVDKIYKAADFTWTPSSDVQNRVRPARALGGFGMLEGREGGLDGGLAEGGELRG